MKKIYLMFLAVAVITSCKKKEDEEPFSEKLDVKVSILTEDLSTYLYQQSNDKSFTIESGLRVNFDFGIGGEEGFGKNSLEEMVSKLEVKIETSRGIEEREFVPKYKLIGGFGVTVPVNEGVKYTFTLVSMDGEKSVYGPIDFQVINNNKVAKSDNAIILDNSTNQGGYMFLSPLYKVPAYSGYYFSFYDYTNYTDNNYSALSPKYVLFGVTKQGSNLYLTSPSQFKTLGAFPNLNDYSGWNTVKIQEYTGSIDLLGFDVHYLFNDYQYLENLNITSTDEKVLAVQGYKFMFQSQEGKKGFGVIEEVGADFIKVKLVYQK
jgi:hypothetical protein